MDAELEAIKAILAALEPLDDAARTRAIQYVNSRMNISPFKPAVSVPSTWPLPSPGLPHPLTGIATSMAAAPNAA